MTKTCKNPRTQRIIEFLEEIGIEVLVVELKNETFLPGIEVERGKLLVDETKLLYPGDLLHEAGHLAVIPANVRKQLSGEIALEDVNIDAIEAQAIAWSYAAALHLDLDPRVVFHENGYKGRSEQLLFGFSMGVYLGVNGLVESGLTLSKLYPQMRKWLRD